MKPGGWEGGKWSRTISGCDARATGALQVPADYSALAALLIPSTLIGLALPFVAIVFARLTKFRSA